MKKKLAKRGWVSAAIFLSLVLGSILLSACGLSSGPASRTTALAIDIAKLADYRFEVPSNSDVTLSISDGQAHTCMILEKSMSISIPAGKSSAAFQLPPGEYKLNCGVPNINAKITSK